jgi:hypothetical protein
LIIYYIYVESVDTLHADNHSYCSAKVGGDDGRSNQGDSEKRKVGDRTEMDIIDYISILMSIQCRFVLVLEHDYRWCEYLQEGLR